MCEAGSGGDGGVEGDDGAVGEAGAFAEGGWCCGNVRGRVMTGGGERGTGCEGGGCEEGDGEKGDDGSGGREHTDERFIALVCNLGSCYSYGLCRWWSKDGSILATLILDQATFYAPWTVVELSSGLAIYEMQ